MGIATRMASDLHPELVALAFETSRDCIKMISTDGTLLLLNAGGAAEMGFENSDAPMGENWIDFWVGVERDAARAAVAAAAGGRPTTFNGFLPTATGLPRWWESTVTPLVASSGQPPERLLVISRDVTARLAAERAERLWQRRYRTLVEASSQVVWTVDGSTGAFESRGWKEFTGRPHEAIEPAGWSEAIHPEDRARGPLAACSQPYEPHVGISSYRLLSEDGEWRWVEERVASVLDDDGAAVGLVGVVTDVHERRVAEQRLREDGVKLRLALESASLGTWEADLSSEACSLSEEARRILGLGEDGCLIDVLHPDDRDAVVARHAENRLRTGGMSLTTFRVVHPGSGETRWIAARGRAVLDDGVPILRVGTFEDFTERKRTKDELRSTLRRHQALLDAVSVVVWHSDAAQTDCVRQGWTGFTGRPADEDEGNRLAAVHTEDRARVAVDRDRGLRDGEPYGVEHRLAHVEGGHRWVRESVVPLHSEDGDLEGWVGVVCDVDERRTAELALVASERRLRLAGEVTGLGTYDVNVTTGARDWSPEFHDLLRLPRTVVPSRRSFLDVVHPGDRDRVEREWDILGRPDEDRPVLTFRLLFGAEERWMEARERVFWGTDGRPCRRVGAMQDVTERKRVEHELWTAAHADALTGVANRTLFQARLDQAIAEADRGGVDACAILIDVDGFKEVNDSVGHAAGDALLRLVARRIQRSCPWNATVGRLGGDEFGVVLPGVRDLAAVVALADRILLALRVPLAHDGREIECSASVGWSAYPIHDGNSAALLRNADMALYAAKRAGRDRVACFDAGMRDELQRRVGVLRLARDALAGDAIVPFYQPKVSLQTGRVVGFEALLRWRDGSGVRPPSDLGEAFADPELACRLGATMLRRVLSDMREWTDDGVPFGHVALNAGAPELHRPDYAERVLTALSDAGLAPAQLEVEVTEDVLLDDANAAVAGALKALHEAGVAVSLDDFGTGYASLSHLKRFPVTWLKVDRSFVSNMETDADARIIVNAVIGLAHNLGLKAVAEGVETEAQRHLLSDLGCDLGQGYLLGRPMAADRVPGFLSGRHGPVAIGP